MYLGIIIVIVLFVVYITYNDNSTLITSALYLSLVSGLTFGCVKLTRKYVGGSPLQDCENNLRMVTETYDSEILDLRNKLEECRQNSSNQSPFIVPNPPPNPRSPTRLVRPARPPIPPNPRSPTRLVRPSRPPVPPNPRSPTRPNPVRPSTPFNIPSYPNPVRPSTPFNIPNPPSYPNPARPIQDSGNLMYRFSVYLDTILERGTYMNLIPNTSLEIINHLNSPFILLGNKIWSDGKSDIFAHRAISSNTDEEKYLYRGLELYCNLCDAVFLKVFNRRYNDGANRSASPQDTSLCRQYYLTNFYLYIENSIPRDWDIANLDNSSIEASVIKRAFLMSNSVQNMYVFIPVKTSTGYLLLAIDRIFGTCNIISGGQNTVDTNILNNVIKLIDVINTHVTNMITPITINRMFQYDFSFSNIPQETIYGFIMLIVNTFDIEIKHIHDYFSDHPSEYVTRMSTVHGRTEFKRDGIHRYQEAIKRLFY